jgi:hypothetical protein
MHAVRLKNLAKTPKFNIIIIIIIIIIEKSNDC